MAAWATEAAPNVKGVSRSAARRPDRIFEQAGMDASGRNNIPRLASFSPPIAGRGP
jgi:hypothetical protein